MYTVSFIGSAMKRIRCGIIVSLISIIFLIILVDNKKISPKGTSKSAGDNKCMQRLNELKFKVINQRYIKELSDICDKNNENNINSLEMLNCSRHLRNLSDPKPYVALASFPGSGNTWTRLLIETATGIQTGSVYRDANFIGSKFCPARGKVFIVKTHSTGNSIDSHGDCVKIGITTLHFSSAIYIIRNPYNAFLAEFNRENADRRTSIMSTVPNESFHTKTWNKFVRSVSDKWKNMTISWLQRKDIPVFVLMYEKLMENVVLEIYKLMKFLNFKIQYKHAYCLLNHMNSKYKRTKPTWLTKENIYNNDLRDVVNSAIEYVEKNIDSDLNISNVLKSYILPTN